MGTYWVILVSDGTVIDFPPEVCSSHALAQIEARRWATLLSGGVASVEVPFEGRYRVGFRDVRLVPVESGDARPGSVWVGTHWTSDGYPDPEAVLLFGRDDAIQWASAPIGNIRPVSVEEAESSVAATYLIRGEEAYSVASMAKLLCESLPT